MTRKHFKAIAHSISLISDLDERICAYKAILPTLQESNPLFNRHKFEEACFPPDSKATPLTPAPPIC